MRTIDWSKITIRDDVMFSSVFRDPGLCRGLLERVLSIPIAKVVITNREHAITPELGSKGIRMDVYVADEAGTVYDVEMQKVEGDNLVKRSRYYLSANDMDCIAEGVPYEGLRDSFVIFICLFDPIEEGLPCYTITPHCRETGGEVPDGATRVFVNATAYEQCEDPRLGCLLAYLSGASMWDDDFCESVEREVRRVRDLPEWRAERMRFEIYVAEHEARAHRKGRMQERELNARLAEALTGAGRADEVASALADQGLFDKLLAEFGIEDEGEDEGDREGQDEERARSAAAGSRKYPAKTPGPATSSSPVAGPSSTAPVTGSATATSTWG